MKTPEGWSLYNEFTAKASDVSRQLAFAAIAVVWVFKDESIPGDYSLSTKLLVAATCAVIGLALDVLQYAYASIVWRVFTRRQEKKLWIVHKVRFDRIDYDKPWFTHGVIDSLFYLKLVAVFVCYCFLFAHLVNVLLA